MAKKGNKNNKLALWWRRAQGHALYAYFRMVTLTSRWRIEGQENIAKAKSLGRPILWTMWHGQLLPSLNYGQKFYDTSNFVAVTVGDERHDILEAMLSWLQVRTFSVDMGGNPVKAGRSVLQIIKEMKRGRESFILPDGPDGPAFEAKDGVGYLATRAEAAVIPVGAYTRHAYELPRWDRYQVPFPFAQINIVFDQPIVVERKMDSKKVSERIAEALTRARSRARVLSGLRGLGF